MFVCDLMPLNHSVGELLVNYVGFSLAPFPHGSVPIGSEVCIIDIC